MKDNQRFNQLKDHYLKESSFNDSEIHEYRNNYYLLIDRGYESIDEGDFNQAFRLFSLGATINDTDPEILNGLGISLCELGKLEESLIILEHTIEIIPDDAITMANMAGVCWELEEYDRAIYFYTKSIDLDEDLEESFFNLINLYLETGAQYMAFIICNKLIDKYPKNEEAKELMEDIILSLAVSLY